MVLVLIQGYTGAALFRSSSSNWRASFTFRLLEHEGWGVMRMETEPSLKVHLFTAVSSVTVPQATVKLY